MEYEKSLFRIYEKIVENRHTWSRRFRILSFICILLAFLNLICLVFLQITQSKANHCIERAWNHYLEANKGRMYPLREDALSLRNFTDSGAMINDEIIDLTNISKRILQSEPLTPEEFKNKDPTGNPPEGPTKLNNSTSKSQMVNFSNVLPYTQNRTSFYMRGDIINFYLISGSKSSSPKSAEGAYPYISPRQAYRNGYTASIYAVSEEYFAMRLTRHKYSWFNVNHTVPVDYSCFAGFKDIMMLGENKDTSVVLDILNTFRDVKESISIFSFEQSLYYYWNSWELKKQQGFFSISLQSKLYELIYLIIGLVIVSFAASLYTKVVSLLSPLILYGLLKCCGKRIARGNLRHLEEVMQQFYKAFTWIGIYLQTIERNRGLRKMEGFFILAIFLTLFFFYFTYICLAHLTSKVLFPGCIPAELDGNLFGFMATVELVSLFFFRTRESLYFAPKIVLASILAFLLYVNFTAYGFYIKAFLVMNFFLLGIIFFCIGAFELPATQLRNEDFSKPTLARPRALFQPLFSLTWFHDLPPFWTLFIPFYDRHYFSAGEMSLLDHNWLLVNNHLRNANRPIDLPAPVPDPNNQIEPQNLINEQIRQLLMGNLANEPEPQPQVRRPQEI